MRRVRRLAVEPFHRRGNLELYLGDLRVVVPLLGYFDAVVTDPPYGINFMGKGWDAGVPGVGFWRVVLAAMKPGAYLLAFGGTRKFHRLFVAIEDAGFEIRDCVSWLYGTGFPKSADVSKAIDKKVYAIELFDEVRSHLRTWRDRREFTNRELNEAVGSASGGGMVSHWMSEITTQPELPSKLQWTRLRKILDWSPCELDRIYDRVKDGAARPVVGTVRETNIDYRPGSGEFAAVDREITAAVTDEAAKWDGWGTALKPAWEPVVLARRPLEGTVAENVIRYGVGGINIDDCRVGTAEDLQVSNRSGHSRKETTPGMYCDTGKIMHAEPSGKGRWPANVAHDGSADVVDLLPGGSDRFFYCAKVSRVERGPGNDHPTVKPISLMRYLLRLVTPPGGVVLDPFSGSGSTLLAAREEGVRAVGVELDPRYAAISARRIGGPRRRVLA